MYFEENVREVGRRKKGKRKVNMKEIGGLKTHMDLGSCVPSQVRSDQVRSAGVCTWGIPVTSPSFYANPSQQHIVCHA